MRRIEDSTMLVTGSTDGLGMRTAHDLAAMGASVLIHGRDPGRGMAALESIRASTGNDRLWYYNADLSSLDEVRSLAKEVMEAHPALHVLVNNAGIGDGKRGEQRREVSRDGYELRFAVNYLAPFLLTHLLLPALERGAPSRVVNVSSLSQTMIDLDDLMLERDYDGATAYGQSKMALAMFTFEMAEIVAGRGITVNALHPGSLLDTKMVRETFGRAMGPAQKGADAEVFLASSPQVEGVTGRFFEGKREGAARSQAYDQAVRERLYRTSLELTGLNGRVATGNLEREPFSLPRTYL
ncbi:MAG: SDR family NAD(P)-dependent oxidoreductase [Methanomassiliicoccus sp.]|nr:SDR family NAD(P)-dependent oxidoreductase [Methanomassiliicoccus sp.]